MEHDKTLWTQPYNDEKYGEEKGASCKYFQEFLKCPAPRDIKEFHKILSKKLSKKGRARIPSLNTIYEYSCKWKWSKRAEAYDKWKRDVDDERLKNSIYNIRKKNIENMEGRFDRQNLLLQQLINDPDVTITSKIKFAEKNSKAYKDDVASFNNLINEGIFKEEDVTRNTGLEGIFKNAETINILDEIEYDGQKNPTNVETDK